MDSFINIFIDLLHYVPYIKDKKVKIQPFLGCLPPNFQERIEFEIPKVSHERELSLKMHIRVEQWYHHAQAV